MEVPQNKGYHFGGPYNQNYSILGSIWGSRNFGKLPYESQEIVVEPSCRGLLFGRAKQVEGRHPASEQSTCRWVQQCNSMSCTKWRRSLTNNPRSKHSTSGTTKSLCRWLDGAATGASYWCEAPRNVCCFMLHCECF